MSVFTKEKFLIWLVRSMDLFQPANSEYYAVFSQGQETVFKTPDQMQIPSHLPQTFCGVQEVSEEAFGVLFPMNSGETVTNFEEELHRISEKSFEDCARILMYIHRANLKFGQKFFFQAWHEGTILAALRRLASTAEEHTFQAETQPNDHIRGFLPDYQNNIPHIRFCMESLTQQKTAVLVCPTDENLSASGGVDRAIRSAAGEKLDEFCKKIGKVPVGRAVMMDGYDLPVRNILHVAIPNRTSDHAKSMRSSCYASCLHAADSMERKSIAFSAMGTGSAGFTDKEAAQIAMQTVCHWFEHHESKIKDVVFCFTSETKKAVFEKAYMACLVHSFKRLCAVANLGAIFRDTLPIIFELHLNGNATTTQQQRAYAQHYHDAWFRLLMCYNTYALKLYHLLGEPDYLAVTEQFAEDAHNNRELPQTRIDQIDFVTCIQLLVMFQRMDYASGGRSCTHLRHCTNGNVERILTRMEFLLQYD